MYSTKVNGQVFQFGTSGFLYRSNKLMYDRGTNTLWHQFLGEPVVGPLADSGIHLELLPVLVTTWGDWVAAHPDTTVLDIETGVYPASLYRQELNPSSTYFEYRADPGPIFPVWQRSDLLPAKEEVLGLNLGGQAKAYPLELLRNNEVVVNDALGGRAIVVVTTGASGAARAYLRSTFTFSPSLSEEEGAVLFLLDQDEQPWKIEEDALVQEGVPFPLRLQRLPSRVAYWFGWYAFYPATAVYGQEMPDS